MVTRIGPKQPRRSYLAKWREAKGLTQEQLADRVGTYKGQISNWESGRRSISSDVQAALAEALGIEPPDLWRDPARPSADELLRDVPPDVHSQAIELLRIFVQKRAS